MSSYVDDIPYTWPMWGHVRVQADVNLFACLRTLLSLIEGLRVETAYEEVTFTLSIAVRL